MIARYSATKIEAEVSVREANGPHLKTVVMRTGHIFGQHGQDCLAGFMGAVPICFREKCLSGPPAAMSVVHVENCALGHIVAAMRATALGGHVVHLCDFDTNIVNLYRAICGRRPAPIVLPSLLLSVVVVICCAVHSLMSFITCKKIRVLRPLIGPHDDALLAARTCTICNYKSKQAIGHTPVVSLEDVKNRQVGNRQVGNRQVNDRQQGCHIPSSKVRRQVTATFSRCRDT